MSTEKIIDLDAINSLKEMLEDNFDGLFVVFQENSKTNVENLQTAYDADNKQDILSFAHILKGSCGSLGLTAMYNLMVSIETSLREDENADISAMISELGSVYQNTLASLIDNGIIDA